MGSPRYEINSGHIYFKEKEITDENPAERAKDGMFLSFQEPLEIPGLSLESFFKKCS